MGYPRRPDVPGATYHVNAQGTNKERIFFDDVDRHAFLKHLERVTETYGWVVLAYCLMTTHYHLVLRVPLGGLSAGMCLLNRGYARQTNRRHMRTMHLFRQRFFSLEIRSESHLLECCRYTDLNPVRAGMCNKPEEWPWSSYRSTVGLDVAWPFLVAQEVLALFDRDLRRAQAAYRDFVRDGRSQVSDTEWELARDDPLRP